MTPKEKKLMRQVDVSTKPFQRSHNKNPHGQGFWAFGFGNHNDLDSLYWLDSVYWFNGPYTKAKQAAKLEAVRRGFTLVTVQP
jgi:hypothetical protein